MDTSQGPYRRTISLPEAAGIVGCTRATAERIVRQYGDRLPPYERIGVMRVWPFDMVEVLRDILAEERRPLDVPGEGRRS